MNVFTKLFILFLLTTFLNAETANKKQHVLILHSYHQSYKWTDDINKGIKSVLEQSNPNMEFFVEYMDTKRFVSEQNYLDLYQLYKNKYENFKFDVIVSSDNNAFNFLKKYNKKIFKGTPIIFCGVNFFKDEQIAGHENFTGVNEEANIKRNYDLIKRIHPNIKNIYTVIDTTTTGKIVKKEALKIAQKYQYGNIKFHILDDLSFEELKTKVTYIPDDSAILMTIFLRDKNNKFLEYYEAAKMISENSKAPLYGLWDFNLGNGIIGGFLTSGYFQGRNAALMAQRILEGEDIKNIKPLYKSPNQYIFDYKEMEKFNITEEQVPSISYILHKPDSFFEVYKREIITIISLFIIMFVFIIILLINIQKRKKAEKYIKKQLKFQQDLIDNVNAPIYYKNKFGEYLGCNKSFEEFIEFNRDEIIGKTAFDIIPKKMAEEYYEKDLELLEEGKLQQYESNLRRKNGQLRDLIFYKNVYYDEEENVDGIIGAIFDITELKSITNELNELNKHLEDEVYSRTVELKKTNEELADSNEELQSTIYNLEQTQKQLIISEKMASLGGLVAGVAHEINTPVGIGVTGISHFLELSRSIQKDYENDEMTQEEFEEFINTTNKIAQSIHINLQRTAQLVRSFKQISVDQTSEEKREFFICEYVSEILLSISNITKKTNLDINVSCDKTLKLNSYPGAISQIVTNLIINSITHAYEPKQKGEINLSIEEKDNRVKLVYKDDGKGIEEKNLHKIFDPFFTTNRQNGGTGLGLNIIYNIATNTLNGTISCISKPKEGAEFTIIFDL